MDKKISKVIAYVKEELAHTESGHDWFHIQRVYNNSLIIAKNEEGADMEVVTLIALLHDIADSKFHGGDETVGPRKAKALLTTLAFNEDCIDHVIKGIENISFGGGNHVQKFTSLELAIVQDADRLDAIGAIGIARAFNYGGYKNNIIHDPSLAPKLGMTKEEYKAYRGTTINHFYEKLLRLKSMMNTEGGKKLAESRHRFMESLLAQFYAEWNAEE